MTEETQALQIIGEIGHVKLEPGDILIVTTRLILTAEAHSRIRQTVESIFAGHKCIVVDSSMTIEVAREVATKSPQQERSQDEIDYDMDRYSAR
jgi:hypothetical protein